MVETLVELVYTITSSRKKELEMNKETTPAGDFLYEIGTSRSAYALQGLEAVYKDACARQDYFLCDKVRLEIMRTLSPYKLLIPVETSL